MGIVEISQAMHEVHSEYFKNIFNSVSGFHVGFSVCQKASGGGLQSNGADRGNETLISFAHSSQYNIGSGQQTPFQFLEQGYSVQEHSFEVVPPLNRGVPVADELAVVH